MWRQIALIFALSYLLNALWENAHVFLYSNYQGGPITEFILLRASLFDAVVTTLFLLPFLILPMLRTRAWLILVIGTSIAIVNEWYGLSTLRWEYNTLMPIIPLIKTGITPTLQLGLLGYIVFKIIEHFAPQPIQQKESPGR